LAALLNTIGIEVIADFAANAESGRPAAKMRDTWRRAKSAASAKLARKQAAAISLAPNDKKDQHETGLRG
jgi:hypothetical protein